MGIKRGVSLYSYQHEYFHHKMNLEDCIKAVADMGATGVEIIPEQMINEYPNLSDEFLAKWHGWMKKYNTTPTCVDAFLDMLLYKNRILSDKECIGLMERDLKVAHQLGCYCIRTLAMTPARIIEQSLPLAEKYHVKIGIEIHSPINIESAWFNPYKALIEKYGSKWFGIIPDMGIFEKIPSPIHQERAIRDGANRKVVEYITKAVLDKVPVKDIVIEIDKMGANAMDKQWLNRATASGADTTVAMGRVYNNPEVLKKHKDYIIHIHGKFYNMLPDCTDDCLDYEAVIPVLREIGFEGCISSEYEGNRTIEDAYEVNSVEQVTRQHKMFQKLGIA
jgi:sugar phosphate isomerase/epimerase